MILLLAIILFIIFLSIKMCENDYIISKNEANEIIILEVPKKPKFTYF